MHIDPAFPKCGNSFGDAKGKWDQFRETPTLRNVGKSYDVAASGDVPFLTNYASKASSARSTQSSKSQKGATENLNQSARDARKSEKVDRKLPNPGNGAAYQNSQLIWMAF